MTSRRAFLGSRILALILVSICLVNWDFDSNLSFLELDQVCMLARYHPHRSFNFFDFDFHTLVEERRHFGSSFYRGGGYLSFRISLYPNSVSIFQLNRLIISGDISENPGPDKFSVCTNTVAKNHRAISCESCAGWCHIKCGKVKPNDYKKLQLADDFTWFCPACLSQPSSTSSHSSLLLNTTFQHGRCKHSLDCIVINARSLRNKLLDFQAIVYTRKIDIVIVSETWLDNTVPDYEILPNGYTIFRKDRIGPRGGGVLLAFKSQIMAWRRYDLEANCELVWCEFLSSLGQKILFGVYYRPTNTGVEYFQCLRDSLATIDDKFDKIFLAGDFNLPGFDWINQVPLSSEPLYLDAYELLNDSFLTQVNFHPTRNNSILDLVLTTVPDLISDIYSFQDIVDSDHNCVSF